MIFRMISGIKAYGAYSRRIIRDRRGFSVAEVLIAIASLALVSVFILQMFIIAAHLNRRAQYTDRAQLLVNSCLEQFSGSTAPLMLSDYPQLKGAELSTHKDGSLRAIVNLGEDFAPCPEDDEAQFRLIADVLFEDQDRLPPLPAALEGNASPVQRSRMLSLSVSVIQLRSDTDPRQIGFGTTIRYEQGGETS